MVITFSFTTRLKIITFISALLIIITLFLFGYELGWRSAIAIYEKKQVLVDAKSVVTEKEKKNSEPKK